MRILFGFLASLKEKVSTNYKSKFTDYRNDIHEFFCLSLQLKNVSRKSLVYIVQLSKIISYQNQMNIWKKIEKNLKLKLNHWL